MEHQTIGVQQHTAGVRSEDYWEFQPGQRVKTTDGPTGRIEAVWDGAFPGDEEYDVTLDGGLGGGRYASSQLRPDNTATAAVVVEGTAAADYPELSQILVERPDPAHVQMTASRPAEPQPDAGEIFARLVTTAAADADFRFQVTAAWRDVVAKAKRIRAEGGVRVTLASDGIFFGEVQGDHHVYETGLQRLPGRMAAHSWNCGCKWGAYHWGADDDFSRFAGRMCSHALALQYEAQSRGMFGREINADERKPAWVPRHVVVRHDIDSGTDKLQLSSAIQRQATVNPYGLYLRFGDWSPEERSNNNMTGTTHEGGVSVYNLDHHGNPMDPDPHDSRDLDPEDKNWPLEEMHGRVGKAEGDRKWGSDRPHQQAHLVKGDLVGFGHDNEPLLQNVRRVGDWMDHRHLFLPEAKPHPLARSEDHEEYEPPEESPSHTHASLSEGVLQALALAAVAAGEDREEVALALRTVGLQGEQGELFDSGPYKVEQGGWGEDFGDDENGHRWHRGEDGERVYPCHNRYCDEGGAHEDGHSAEQHRDVYTDWDAVHPHLGPHLHRGMALDLPDDVHNVVHDDSRSTAERAHALTDHLREQGLGMHWTPNHEQAQHYTGVSDSNGNNTHVVVHAHTPDKDAIETDPDTLADRDVIAHGDHDDTEVPLREGAELKLKGISWRHRGDKKWVRHDFDQPVQHEASVYSPFGEPSGTAYQLPKAPGATSPKMPWENPASAGPLSTADPVGWNRKLPLESYAALDSALFEPEAEGEPDGAEAMLHEEPEAALPATDGVQLPSNDEALTPSMTAGLRRQALKDFSFAEQQELINEGEGVKAANLDRLDIKGTHYAELEQVLAGHDDDVTWLA